MLSVHEYLERMGDFFAAGGQFLDQPRHIHLQIANVGSGRVVESRGRALADRL